jgi:predicted GH43/DUF377 family glycosyl hydrolase
MFLDDLIIGRNFIYSWSRGSHRTGIGLWPIRTEKGWLLLTHGVGPMRKYVISAILLDLQNPALIVGRLDKPFIEADELEREGYVPNVVYTCGFMRHGNLLIIPYAVSVQPPIPHIS